MIGHDEGFLYSEPKTEGASITDDDCIQFAKQYHEHMTRWRSADELPEVGQRIEVAHELLHPAGRAIDSFNTSFDGKFTPSAIKWRPIGPLPEQAE